MQEAIDVIIEFGERNYHRSLIYPMLLDINGSKNLNLYCVECLQSLDYLIDDRLNYNIEGGGANKVLFKRSIMSIHSPVARVHHMMNPYLAPSAAKIYKFRNIESITR